MPDFPRHLVILLALLSQAGAVLAAEAGEGERLARIHCAGCHAFPEPSLLPKRSWKFTLSYMGLRMGIQDLTQFDKEQQKAEIELLQNRKQLIQREGAMPAKPMVNAKQWVAIRDYYLQTAPEKAPPPTDHVEAAVGLNQFEVRVPDYDRKLPITTMIHVDERHGEILIGDSGYERMGSFGRDLKLKTDYATKGFSWVRAVQRGDRLHLLSIGDLMGGSPDQKLGRISFAVREGGRWANKGIALSGLHRPVDMDLGDFDGDGRDELVITQFGFATGGVNIHRFADNGWQVDPRPVHRLAQDPGAMDSHVADFDGDGRADVAVLFGQARENVSLFLNKGEGRFERIRIIEEHSSFGYVGFEWVDFDGDGDLDVLTVNGDNVDSDPYNILKSDHGVRLHLNDGKLKFTEAYFHPMQGAYGMQVRDFDLDGDLDIAAVAFNPDFAADDPERFVHLENLGSLKFAPKTIKLPKTDRWMSIGAGDFDGDGDPDLVLGGGYVPAGLAVDYPGLMKEMAEKGRPLLILENKAK